MEGYVLLISGAVVFLTISAIIGATMLAWRSAPVTPFSQRLLAIFLWIALGGFFAIFALALFSYFAARP
jgi:hypothetical protein